MENPFDVGMRIDRPKALILASSAGPSFMRLVLKKKPCAKSSGPNASTVAPVKCRRWPNARPSAALSGRIEWGRILSAIGRAIRPIYPPIAGAKKKLQRQALPGQSPPPHDADLSPKIVKNSA